MLARLQIADPEMVADRYPHQLSGGMRQRVCIAMAFIMKPDLLILDEPTTNLDVTTEANILDMLNDLKNDFSATTLYITHDLGVVYKVSDRVGVMYGGRFVEEGYIADIICSPKHPYTRGLLRCIPEVLLDKSKKRLTPITGTVAELDAMPQGCAFSPRCSFRRDTLRRRRSVEPALREGTARPLSLSRARSTSRSGRRPPATRSRAGRNAKTWPPTAVRPPLLSLDPACANTTGTSRRCSPAAARARCAPSMMSSLPYRGSPPWDSSGRAAAERARCCA